MFSKLILFIAVVVVQADEAHWLCEEVPSNEWTSHYCTKSLGPRETNGVNHLAGVSTSETDDASIEEQTYVHLENHDVESVTDFNEAMLILNMPDSLRVSVDQLHIFSNPPAVGKVEVHDDGEDTVFISGEPADTNPHVCGETHPECLADAFQPCGPACCANSTCACASNSLGGQPCCVCSSVVQAFVHAKRMHYVTSSGCTQVYVTSDVISPTKTVFHKHHVEKSVAYCNSLHN